MSKIFNLFSLFPGYTFTTWKWRLSCGKPPFMPHAFMDSEHLDHNPQKNREIVEQFARKLQYMFSTPPGKGGKVSNILGNVHFYCHPCTGLKTSWNFATIYSCLRDPFIYRDTHISKFVTMNMYVKNMMHNIRSGTLKIKVKIKEWKNGTCAMRLEIFESI